MLYELGYRLTDAASLKRKHVEALVERWKAEDLAIATIKNRMADLRWWAEKMRLRPPHLSARAGWITQRGRKNVKQHFTQFGPLSKLSS